MRKKIAAGNWKMNTTYAEGETLAKAVASRSNEVARDVTMIVAPPFTHLCCMTWALRNVGIGVSAQNCANRESGAFTGEVSAKMLEALGVQYCILGHSERRQYYGETNAILAEKIALTLKFNLTPIFCIGEKLEERDAMRHFDVVKTQLDVLLGLTKEDFAKVIVAYEPVWAIGTGKTATSQQAQEMHAFIRKTLADKFGAAAADATSILYGGSCNPKNAKELFAQPDVDGGLIGGASLVADDFIAIAKSF
jgi:triosephosphate isomerase